MIGKIRVSGWGATREIHLYGDRAEITLPKTRGNSGELLTACQEAVLRMRSENGGTVQAGITYLKEHGYELLLDGVDDETLKRSVLPPHYVTPEDDA